VSSALAPADRRLVIGIATVMAAATVSGATFNYVVGPLTLDLGSTEEQASFLRQLPSLGELLVIFLIGTWGVRFGPRRMITLGAVAMAVGYAIVSLAPVMPVVSLGMLLGSVGRTAVFVVAISQIAARLVSEKDRATGFATVAGVTPGVYTVAPLAAAALLEFLSWRAVTLAWALAALAGAVAARRMLPPDDLAPPQRAEMWTPALAGLVLTSMVQTMKSANFDGWTAVTTIAWFATALASSVALAVLMRTMAHPTLDVSVIRRGGFPLLLLVVALVPFSNLWFYTTVAAQAIYGYSAVQTALFMAPVQMFGVFGAWLTGRIIQRRGIRIAGTLMLVTGSAMLFLSAVQTVSTPFVVPAGTLCVYTIAMTGVAVALTNAIMNLAPPGGEGSASALRKAAASLGAAIGIVVMNAVVFGALYTSMSSSLVEQGRDVGQATQIVEQLWDGLASEEVAAQNSVPIEAVQSVALDMRIALMDGYRAHGLTGGAITLMAALVFFANRKGVRRPEERSMAGEPPAGH
jgi:predicted MFS family arabinose efflux permease